ncbi:hypothetical protein COT78_03185 [Candidatus Berkelbacteria bacterium CG10_big_fil_rev_8_21_14_0_10_43_13]|uniref:Thymidylate synthase/dCMP hydroxymethylase domain-containing protein n=1 Tax=Candidatus Berkelbacteria bacterium CG10_big_fil_rev_8_21_14_0_10_43_13 TaxID=1974514 RepID=A0A2H0W609_9BACT|nr:MAG: hypothetical protein COT78_03185 [Candidatus Berkelbacteria bacterium CG10_big_fil_rev_8_21_14_0_10_43_13]
MEKIFFVENTIGSAWFRILNLIVETGNDFYDEGRPLRELNGIKLTIRRPDHKDGFIWSVGNKKVIELFRKSFLGSEKWLEDVDIVQNFGKNDAISYSVRLFDYEGFDQVENIIERLVKIPESKRCMIITPLPHRDWKLDYLPCIDTIHFLTREDKINTYIHCRGLDFAQKAYANFICLAELQSYVLNEIIKRGGSKKYRLGTMDIMIDSAHIYSDTLPIAKKLIEKGRKYNEKSGA